VSSQVVSSLGDNNELVYNNELTSGGHGNTLGDGSDVAGVQVTVHRASSTTATVTVRDTSSIPRVPSDAYLCHVLYITPCLTFHRPRES
jgi:hypothetical protein